MRFAPPIKLRKKPLVMVLAVAAALALITGILLLTPGLRRGDNETPIVTYSTDKPSEEKPGDDFKWQGGADDPKFIRVSSVGVEGYIQNVGVDQNQEVAVPDNIHMAGWFADSVKPGQTGLSIIDGHVDGNTQDAIFKNLPAVQPGAEIIVEFGSGEKKTFRVMDVVTTKEDEAASVLFSQKPTVTSQLNLITCIGTFNEETRRYDERVIVTAELI